MTRSDQPIVLGVDVGTSGVRALAVTAEGEVLAEAHAALADLPVAAPAHEQDANAWWLSFCRMLYALRARAKAGERWRDIEGIAVTSTSGSLVLADAHGEPVRPAMLYDDGRAAGVAREFSRQLPSGQAQLNASFSLAKALWVRQEEPAVWARASYVLHPADWLTAKLTRRWGVSDYSNALKLGYDLETSDWSAAMDLSGLPASMLPEVVAPGCQVGVVSPQASGETGLSAGVPVLAGASDGMASLIGSGASEPGHANTTLGTTLVWKVLSTTQPQLGPGMYCHYHPGKLWAPGAASNTGPGSLQGDSSSLAELDRLAATYLPTSTQCYLLAGRGERFPFLHPKAEPFFEGEPGSRGKRHAAQLQSLACVERWGYERLEAAGVAVGRQVYSAGGAAASAVLSQLRANVLNRAVVRCEHPSASFGAAVLAAGTALFGGDLIAAIRAMTRIAESYSPQPEADGKFEKAYQLFRAACARHGFE
jgi:sugar (pentulose or hexulose) kinase